MINQQLGYKVVEQPCRNFNILAQTLIQDPWDNREKLVLSNFAAGEIGNLIFIDTVSGEAESFLLPGDSGAWGLVNWHNEKLVVGTCPQHAYLHCFDLKTRTWAESLQAPGNKYFWDMTLGSDDMVYGGTWPDCSLIRYDPKRHVLEHMGRVSDNPKNCYSRPVNGSVPGYILVAGGYDVPFLKAFHIESGTFRDFGTPGFVVREANEQFIATEKDGVFEFYDPATFEPLPNGEELRGKLSDRSITLPNGKKNRVHYLAGGRFIGVRGQDYFVLENREQAPELKRIPVPAPATTIHTLAVDQDGVLWGSCGFGQTIFSYNPKDDSYWNSSSVCDSGGEVYGMQFVNGKLYMSAYVGGDHIVYDPAQPWNQLHNVNPRTLTPPVRPDFVRPEGRSVIGPDGGFWTGWSAKYGAYGGALSRVDLETLEVKVWKDQIPGQAVAGVTADDRYIYFTTNGSASGLPYKEEPCHFGVWSTEGKVVYSHQFEPEQHTGGAVLALAGKVLVRVGTELRLFDVAEMAFTKSIPLGQSCGWMIAVSDDTAAAFCNNSLFFVNVVTGEATKVCDTPGSAHAAVKAPDGTIYFSVKSVLYKLEA